MKRQILAGAMALVLIAGMASGAMADHRGASGKHWRHGHRVVGSYVGSYGGRDAGPAYGGHYYSLGPLGFTSVPPGSYSGYGTSISAFW